MATWPELPDVNPLQCTVSDTDMVCLTIDDTRAIGLYVLQAERVHKDLAACKQVQFDKPMGQALDEWHDRKVEETSK